MLFNSLEYLAFLGVILLLYYSLTHRFQNLLLLGASLFFYAYWDYRFLSLLLISTWIAFHSGQAIHRSPGQGSRRLFLWLSITANLCILGYFKYFDFFVQNFGRLTRLFGLETNITLLQLALPVGISFYTFQAISYTIDVYRKKVEPTASLPDFVLYMSYFPKVVAGPIERASDLIPQFRAKRVVTTGMFASGCLLILIGLFRKVGIADALSSQIDPYFRSPADHTSPELVKAAYLFALQIYCDFAGYSDIARGTSRLFGVELTINFNHPYFAATISDFWQRWHISLSTWFRDYLFFPLCGKKNTQFRVCRNLFVTMLVAGLWHGPAWAFVVWGGLHGLYLASNFVLLRKLRLVESLPLWSWKRLVAMLVTFHLVLVSLIIFRTSGLNTAASYIGQIFAFSDAAELLSILPMILIPWLLVLALDLAQHLGKDHTVILGWPQWARIATVTAMFFLVLLGSGIHAPFIYLRF